MNSSRCRRPNKRRIKLRLFSLRRPSHSRNPSKFHSNLPLSKCHRISVSNSLRKCLRPKIRRRSISSSRRSSSGPNLNSWAMRASNLCSSPPKDLTSRWTIRISLWASHKIDHIHPLKLITKIRKCYASNIISAWQTSWLNSPIELLCGSFGKWDSWISTKICSLPLRKSGN